MRRNHRRRSAVTLGFAVALLGAGCGDEPDADSVEGEGGLEFIDGAQLLSDNLTSFDPGRVLTVDEAQVTSAVFDGLTDFDFTDPANPELEPLVAERFESNEDASQWTFTIRPDRIFSNGDPVLPSSFKFAWERAGRADFASPYGYLIGLIQGGAAMQEEGSTVTELDSIVADDANMTLQVTLEQPNADFPAIVSHTFFMPVPEDEVSENPDEWGQGIMSGNGPFVMAEAPTDQRVVLSRNDTWSGNVLGDTRAVLDRLTFTIVKDLPTAYTDFESGNLHSARIPPGKMADAQANYQNTVSTPILGSDYVLFGFASNPQLSDEERDNSLLRKAISLAIDREEINAKIYEGVRVPSTGIVMPGIPGFKEGICNYCDFALDEAKRLLQQWKDGGGSLDEPVTIDFPTGGGQEDLVAILQENLRALGIESTTNPLGEDYFATMAGGGCHFCRSDWYADYPTYGNFTFDLFSTAAIGGNNYGSFSDPIFDQLLAEAQSEPDEATRASLYNQAEDHLLNNRMAVVPLNWYTGDQVYSDVVARYEQTPVGLILWERVGLEE